MHLEYVYGDVTNVENNRSLVLVISIEEIIFRNVLATVVMQFFMGASEETSLMTKFRLWAVQYTETLSRCF
jgi:hypothetical protein